MVPAMAADPAAKSGPDAIVPAVQPLHGQTNVDWQNVQRAQVGCDPLQRQAVQARRRGMVTLPRDRWPKSLLNQQAAAVPNANPWKLEAAPPVGAPCTRDVSAYEPTNRGKPSDGEGLPRRPQMHQLHHGGPEAQSIPLAPLSNQLLEVSAELHPRGGMDHLVPGVGSTAGSQIAHGKTGSLPAQKRKCLSKGSALKKREQTLFWPSHLSQNIRWFKPMAVMNTVHVHPSLPDLKHV